ncbi:MAG: class I SAM-dependent methyltransferase [Pirellulales bacterium]|nr:class I SAM-dependent methyltransferase [Pirellulales bacterium]
MSIIRANWYDYPAYYDLAFRSETTLEADFIEAACRKYCPFAVRRLMEPACGTGRLIVELAARGYRMAGFDLSDSALRYCRKRLARKKLRADLFVADMADFQLPFPAPGNERRSIGRKVGGEGCVDAAYNTFNSFRHLLTEQSARSHLECVARCVRRNGLYILGFHLLPPDASEECIERWTESRGRTRVSVTLRVLATDRRKRIETLRVSLLVRDKEAQLRLRDEFRFRLYTAAQFRRLLAQTPAWELCDVYDFWYEIDRPLALTNELSDTVFILKKR